jgi:FkbM family methyltransferase
MNDQPGKRLYRKLEKKGFRPQHVVEVGVWKPEMSNIFDYIEAGIRTMLVEPDSASIERIKERFGSYENVTLHEVAAYDFEGELELSQRDASTFVSELEASPAIVNDGYEVTDDDKFTVKCTTFDQLDDGSIDLISVDTEGSEWFVLKYIKSRPDVISIETHGAAYTNPHLDKITSWMTKNGYELFFKDKSDSVFVRPERIKIGPGDRLALALTNLRLGFRRFRKQLFSGR